MNDNDILLYIIKNAKGALLSALQRDRDDSLSHASSTSSSLAKDAALNRAAALDCIIRNVEEADHETIMAELPQRVPAMHHAKRIVSGLLPA